MCGNPDVIGRQRSALAPKRGSNTTEPIRRHQRNRQQRDVGTGQKIVQLFPVRFVSGAVSESEKELAGNNDGNENLLRPAHAGNDTCVTPKQRRVRVGIEQHLHFHSASSTVSQEAMPASSRFSSAADQRPMNRSRASPTAVADGSDSTSPAPRRMSRRAALFKETCSRRASSLIR